MKISRDLKKSALDNRSAYLKQIDELEHRQARESGILILIMFVVGVIGVAWIVNQF